MRRRTWLGAAALAPLGGCAALAPPPMGSALRAQSPAGLPRRALLAQTPFFPSPDTLCGPVVLAEAVQAAGGQATPETLRPQVYLPERAGTLQAEMLAGARRQGLLAVELPPQLGAVLAEVAAGTPVALLLNLSLPIWPRWHYALLTGYDLDAGEAWLHSGTQRHARWQLTPLEHSWARSGHWAFVVLPPGRWPQQVDEAAALRALVGLDRAAADPRARLAAWRSAEQRWPQRLALRVGHAQALADAGEGPGAEALLEDWLRTADSAVAWNNLALLRLARGERAAAQQAAARAVARAQAGEPRWLEEALATQRQCAGEGAD